MERKTTKREMIKRDLIQSDLIQSRGEPEGSADCPRCENKLLIPGRAGDARVLRCLRCNGTWVPKGQAVALRASFPEVGPLQKEKIERIRRYGAKRNLSDGVQYLACPNCKNLMTRRQFTVGSGIVVDRCLSHGVWFDGGELELAAQYFAAGGPRLVRDSGAFGGRPTAEPSLPVEIASGLAELLLWML